MAEITLEYDARSIESKRMLELLLLSRKFKLKKGKPNGLDIALQEVQDGKTTTYKNVDEFIKAMKKNMEDV